MIDIKQSYANWAAYVAACTDDQLAEVYRREHDRTENSSDTETIADSCLACAACKTEAALRGFDVPN